MSNVWLPISISAAAVIDLKIGPGTVSAQVMGSSLYLSTVRIVEVADTHWQAIVRDCARSIDTLVELLRRLQATSITRFPDRLRIFKTATMQIAVEVTLGRARLTPLSYKG